MQYYYKVVLLFYNKHWLLLASHTTHPNFAYHKFLAPE